MQKNTLEGKAKTKKNKGDKSLVLWVISYHTYNP